MAGSPTNNPMSTGLTPSPNKGTPIAGSPISYGGGLTPSKNKATNNPLKTGATSPKNPIKIASTDPANPTAPAPNPSADNNPTLAPTVPPPTVVTSEAGKTQAAKDKAALDAAKNSYVPPGFTRNVLGQLTPIPGYAGSPTATNVNSEGNTTNTSTASSSTTDTTGTSGASPAKDLGDSVINNLTSDYNDLKSQLDTFAGKFTADENAVLASIDKTYNNSVQSLADAVAQQTQAAKMAGIRSGVARFSPTSFASAISKPARDSVSKLQELADNEQKAIADAKMAGDNNQFKVLQEKTAAAKQYAADKSAELTRLHTIAKDDAAETAAKLKAAQDQQQRELENQTKARDFALAHNITKPFYVVGNSIVSTSTGELVDAKAMQAELGLTDDEFAKIDWTDPANKYIDSKVAGDSTNNQFVPATEYQPAGTYNKTTGQFTPLAGGTGGTGLANTKPLSASELSTYASMGYSVKPGMSLADITAEANANGGAPPPDPDIVQKLVDGDMLLTDVIKGRGQAGQQELNNYIKAAIAKDPSFSVSTNQARVAFNKRWLSGDLQNNQTAINTALGHLSTLKEQAGKLDNTKLQKYNTIAQWFSKETGSPEVTTFNQTLTLLSEELAKVYKGGNASPSDVDVQNQKAVLEAKYSPAQINSLIDNTANLLSSKLSAMGDSYKKVMGKDVKAPVVDAEKLDQLKASGIDVSKIHDPYFDAGKTLFDKLNPGQDYNAMLKQYGFSAMQQYLEQNKPSELGFNDVGSDTNTGAGTTQNRPDRNNNPLNIKVGELTQKWLDSGKASIDSVPATDGGKFLAFHSVQDGLQAAKDLLTSSAYSKLPIDAALRKWSGNGYGAEVTSDLDKNKKIGDLTDNEITQLIKAMAKKEGFTGNIG